MRLKTCVYGKSCLQSLMVAEPLATIDERLRYSEFFISVPRYLRIAITGQDMYTNMSLPHSITIVIL